MISVDRGLTFRAPSPTNPARPDLAGPMDTEIEWTIPGTIQPPLRHLSRYRWSMYAVSGITSPSS